MTEAVDSKQLDFDPIMTPSGYKETEVGLIPSDWDVVRLKSVCSMKSGESITSASIDSFSKFPCYGGNGMRGFAGRSTHKGRYALIGRQGALCGNVLGVEGEFFASEHAIVVTPLEQTEIRWLTYVLREMNLNQYSESSAQPGLSVSKILELQIAFPSNKIEQESVANVLSDTDALISSLEKLIEKKRNIKQGAMQELLTGKRRLPGFSGEWKKRTLGEIGECIIGLTYKPTDVVPYGLLVLRSSNIQNGQLEFLNNVYVNFEVPEKLRIKDGDILICVRNGSRAFIGKCVRLTEKNEGMTFGAFMSVYRSEYSRFISHLFQTRQIQEQIHENIGATINQITNKNLNSFKINLPQPEEQIAIVEILDNLDGELAALGQKLQKLQMLKQGMMQVLLTGKIRLV